MQAQETGYPAEPAAGKPALYQGHLFRILRVQGSDAPGGAKSYVATGRMTGGFALLAWPVTFGSSGIMTFIAEPDGVVYQKDLGPRTAEIAGAMQRLDPDASWTRIDIVQ